MNEDALELEELYKWLDEIKLSRVKKNIARDFSDGVLMAELLKTFYPRLVDLHNYPPANSHTSKLSNWTTLNKKVLCKLELSISQEKITAIVSSTPGVIEEVLKNVKRTVETRSERKIYGSNAHLSFFTDIHEAPEHIGTENIGNEYEQWQKHAKALSNEITKMKKELDEKDKVIDILHKKVTHLETMLELKDTRLQDLTKQLNRYQELSLSNKSQTSSISTILN